MFGDQLRLRVALTVVGVQVTTHHLDVRGRAPEDLLH